MKTSTIIKHTLTADHLRTKLLRCGSFTRCGFRHYCRSPACDRCRRYRAGFVSGAVADWALDLPLPHRVQRITCTTRQCRDPDELVQEIARLRTALRQAYSYRRRTSARWESVQHYGVWSMITHGLRSWSAQLSGVISLGDVGEMRWEDEVGASIGARVRPIAARWQRADVQALMHDAMVSLVRNESADDAAIVLAYGALDARGGTKALLHRRGLQCS